MKYIKAYTHAKMQKKSFIDNFGTQNENFTTIFITSRAHVGPL